MGSKTAFVLALLGTAALAAAGVSLALYVTRPQREAFIVTRRVTESLTRTVTQEPANRAQPVLSPDGRLLWQLEALLQDTFGSAEFYLHYEGDVARFDTRFTGGCCSESWTFTFADARGSQLRLDDPGRAPPAKIELSAVRSP